MACLSRLARGGASGARRRSTAALPVKHGIPRVRSLDEQVLIAPPRRPDKPPVELRLCDRPECGRAFEPLMTGSGPKRFCSAQCRHAETSARQKAKHKKLREFGPAEGERYYVNEITGIPMDAPPRSRPTAVFSVVDDAYGVEIARFDAGGYGSSGTAKRRRAAHTLAARLNKDERDWENCTGRYEPDPEAKPRKTHCKRGHPLSGDNLYVSGRYRVCKECRAQRDFERRAIRRLTEDGVL